MAAVHDEEDAGFWPGYVAAVSGLVQGLLIMAMALATAIFALGQAAKLSKPSGGGQAAAPAPVLAPPPAGQPRPELLPLPALVPPVGLAGPAPEVSKVAGRSARISAGFQGDAVILPASAVPGLLQSVYRAQGVGVQRWRITIPARLDDPRDQRAAYLRLIGLRALLVKNGVAAEGIDLWIESSGGQASSAREALIEPLDASGNILSGNEAAGDGQ